MNPENNFYKLLLTEILENLTNRYHDNYDEARYGKTEFNWKKLVKHGLEKKLNARGISLVDSAFSHSFAQLSPYLDDISFFYNLLADQESRHLLVRLVAYRILGYKKYKLPLNTPAFWKGIEDIDKLKDNRNCLIAKFAGNTIPISCFNLEKPNPPISIYYTPKGIYSHLNIKQYKYITDAISIKPEQGDIVLDCGACWGDTALFFAHEIGKSGHVYSFEFIPDNINIFNTNISLERNSYLKNKITLVTCPLDEITGKEVSYDDKGPGSRIFSDHSPAVSKATTICINDFFKQYRLEKVDFIKMDIEGAELPALKGALDVIQQFRPKLAISIYHSLDDFTGIVKYIESLNLEYEFYLKHGSIHHEETILFAVVPNNF